MLWYTPDFPSIFQRAAKATVCWAVQWARTRGPTAGVITAASTPVARTSSTSVLNYMLRPLPAPSTTQLLSLEFLVTAMTAVTRLYVGQLSHLCVARSSHLCVARSSHLYMARSNHLYVSRSNHLYVARSNHLHCDYIIFINENNFQEKTTNASKYNRKSAHYSLFCLIGATPMTLLMLTNKLELVPVTLALTFHDHKVKSKCYYLRGSAHSQHFRSVTLRKGSRSWPKNKC